MTSEVTIALAQAQRELVDSMNARFEGMSWVTSATLCQGRPYKP